MLVLWVSDDEAMTIVWMQKNVASSRQRLDLDEQNLVDEQNLGHWGKGQVQMTRTT